LDAARLEAGEMTLRARPLDLGACIRATALSFAPLAERRGVTFEVETPADALEVWADADKLDAVVVNLLSNAFKFTPQGGGVSLSVGSAAEDGAWVRVRDNGPGIAPADLEHVFDRFYRVEETGGTEGTGIGLSLARDLAVLHGGVLEAESIEGLGSVFTLTLPLGRDHLEDGQIAPAALEDGPPQLAVPALDPAGVTEPDDADDRTTVLVADDNADIRAYVRSHLADRYRVLEAADGARALEVARQETPDLIVSDIMMPGLDGVGLVRALRADPATDFIPVVLLTAKAEEADVQAGLDAGADAYVVKPFNAQTLQARIDNLVASRQSLRVRFATSGDGLASATPEAVDPEMSPFVVQARSVVEERLGDDTFAVSDFADALGITRSTLHRRLKSETGTTPSAFVRDLRLEHARRLLEDGAGSVSEVGYAVGFRSVSHFSRSFSTRYGMTPSAVGQEAARG
ncbi:hybrid sensor histidine kinase/response regulator transcription factor, partial [Rubrivirga sp.]|uniref:hybrid sensor histidine kinase/response regulator transcription factor n=1 Tax=Rubrivirga sp. TaxID=1885344 RepID=UPI003C72A119